MGELKRDELVEKMLTAFWELDGPLESTMQKSRTRMSRVLDVARDELLPDPTECDYEKELDAVLATWNWDKVESFITKQTAAQMIRDAICIFWTSRRSQLERVKTPEERVKVVKWVLDPTRWIALVDDWNLGNTSGFKDKRDAEIYRLGLIQNLKDKADANS